MATTKRKVPITTGALIQRINRKLKKQGEAVRTARSQRTEQGIGRYYQLDLNGHLVTGVHINLEKLGKNLEVLAPWEEVSDD